MQKYTKIVFWIVLVILISYRLFYFSSNEMIGTYYACYNSSLDAFEHSVFGMPEEGDSIELFLDGRYSSNYFGNGKYHLNRRSILLLNNENVKNIGLSREYLFLTPVIIIDNDNNFFFRKE